MDAAFPLLFGPCSPRSPLRLTIIGCGAIVELVHAPSLARLEQAGLVRVVAVVDPSADRRVRVAKHFLSEPITVPLEALDAHVADAALIASPAVYHREQCIQMLQSGLHVLCEKPLALTASEVEQISYVSERADRICAVGLQRRFWDSCAALGQALRSGWIGSAKRVEVSAGGPFSWAAATDSFFRKESAGGGVLLDLGIHLLDILTCWFGEWRVTSYEDDSLGGVESSCVLRMSGGDGLEALIRLTREFSSRNLCRIVGECGELVWNVFSEAEFSLRDGSGWKKVVAGRPPAGLEARDPIRAARSQDRLWCAFLDAIEGQPCGIAAASQMVSRHQLIDVAYGKRELLAMPWIPVSGAVSVRSGRSSKKRVAVLGASGFIGGRLCQIACEMENGWDVVPLVRRATGLANLARLPLSWRRVDAFDVGSLVEAFAGCEVVVDALLPGLVGIDRAAENVARAADRAGVKRLIYLSSQAVFGADPAEGIDETTPLPARGIDPYMHGKIRAERALIRIAKRSDLEIIILRPGIVYGAGSRWVSTFAALFESGAGWVVNAGKGICNAIYLDNLVHAIGLAIEFGPLVDNPRTYFVNDEQPLTWQEYLTPIAAACGVAFDSLPDPPPVSKRSALDTALALRSKWLAKVLLPRLPTKFKRALRAGLAEWSAVPPEEPALYGEADADRPVPTRDPELVALQSCRWRFPSERIRTELGFREPISFFEGMWRSLEWWKLGKEFSDPIDRG